VLQPVSETKPIQITATASVYAVMKALEYNRTVGVDDRVLSVACLSGGSATVKRKRAHAEQQNGQIAIQPESLIEHEQPQLKLKTRNEIKNIIEGKHNMGDYNGVEVTLVCKCID